MNHAAPHRPVEIASSPSSLGEEVGRRGPQHLPSVAYWYRRSAQATSARGAPFQAAVRE